MTEFKKTCIVTNVQHRNDTKILTLMPVYETRHKFTITVPMTDDSIFDTQPDFIRTIEGHYEGQILNLDKNNKITDDIYHNTKSVTYEVVCVTGAEVIEKYGKKLTLKGADLTRRTIWVESDNVHYDTGRFDTVLVRWTDSFDCEIVRNFTLEDRLSKLYERKPQVTIVPCKTK